MKRNCANHGIDNFALLIFIIIIIIITIFKHGTISQYIKYLQKRKKKSDLPIGRVLNYYINIKKIYCLSICNCFILLLKVDKPFCDFNSIGRLISYSHLSLSFCVLRLLLLIT